MPGMIATRAMELRKRRGLMITLIAMSVGFPAVFMLIRVLAHAIAPRSNPPAGGQLIFNVLAAGFLPTFGFIVPATAGSTAGSRDLSEGMFRHLVVTGRSRLALYLARIPAGLAIVVPLVAIGFTIVCAVCVFGAPTAVNDDSVNIPPGLSRAGFANWAQSHATQVICELPYSGSVPGNIACDPGLGGSLSSVSPAEAAPPALEALAVTIARQDYPGYAAIWLSPPDSLMIETGLWIELEAIVGFVIGLGVASLMGQRTIPMILLVLFPLMLTPILATLSIPHLQDVQRWFVGLAVAHLEPAALPFAAGLPGVSGGMTHPGEASPLLPESGIQAVCVIIAWLAAWTVLGAWRMMTRDA